MDNPQPNPIEYCVVCCSVGTNRCSRCMKTFYCSRQHQINHWSVHKKECKKHEESQGTPQSSVKSPATTQSAQTPTVKAADNYSAYGGWCQNNLPYEKITSTVVPDNTYDPCGRILDIPIPSEDEIFSSLNSEVLSSDNNFWEIINSCDAQNLFEFGTYSEKERAIAKISEALQTGAPTPQLGNPPDSRLHDVQNMDLMQCASLHEICRNVVHDLTKFGICVLDRFIGAKLGNSILAEVKQMYSRGIFKKGELTNPNPYLSKESIRRDVTTWVDGSEPGCTAIGNLMEKLDVVVTTCNKLPKNGLMSRYKLHRRTKAMVACYPGNGTYYKKHIDNPHKDGRCITCIYYLNQNWDVKRHGGLLRMFPAANPTNVANIEPIFDRMIFFWSDKRNPHEVLPSFATRFAITVWYFDADERDRALLASKEKSAATKPRSPYKI